MAKYGRLNEDTVYFLKGTEFEITNENDGFYTVLPFYGSFVYWLLHSPVERNYVGA